MAKTIEQKIVETLKKSINTESQVMPVFIESDNASHRECFRLSSLIFSELLRLVRFNYLTPSQLKFVHNNIFIVLDDMADICPLVSLHYHTMTIELIEYYIQLSLDDEAYEIATNCRNLLDIFKKTIV